MDPVPTRKSITSFTEIPPEYVFGLLLALILLIVYYLHSLEPYPPSPSLPEPPPSPPLSPCDPDISIESYDEAAIISSINTIYDMLLALACLKKEEICYPPPDDHPINLDLCKILGLSPRVVSFMQRMPCPKDIETSEHFNWIAESRSIPYIDEDAIKESRDPENACGSGDERLDYLLPTDVALTIGGRYGKSLVLDTEENTIRTIDFYDVPESHDSMERPDDPYHYRNYPGEPALEVLRRYIHRYRSLADIPRRDDHSIDRWDRKKHPELKRILIEEYGWPDHFRTEDWARDHERILYEIDNRFELEE